MQRLVIVARIGFSVAVALFKRVIRRLIRGPRVPSWSWSTEMTVVAMRALVTSSSPNGDRSSRRELERRLDPRLSKDLQGLVSVESSVVGGIAGEWHRRTDSLPARGTVLYLHGGAYLAGNPATHRRFAARLAWTTRTDIFVADYRLAPRHRFPAAVDDAEAAYEGLVAMGIAPDEILVAGDSAGGGLSCALVLRLRDAGKPLPAGVITFSPYTDLEHTGASTLRNRETDYLPFGNRIIPNQAYLGDADPRHPQASPMYGDYRGFPPMLIFAGGVEMILDDSIRLADKARADGSDVDLIVEEDMFHVWPALLPRHPATTRTLARCAAFADAALSP